MEDYLTVLLNDLEDHAFAFLPGGYYLALHRESAAAEALAATFTQEQHALFDVFEDARNASTAAYQEALAWQAFLLAREIYR